MNCGISLNFLLVIDNLNRQKKTNEIKKNVMYKISKNKFVSFIKFCVTLQVKLNHLLVFFQMHLHLNLNNPSRT